MSLHSDFKNRILNQLPGDSSLFFEALEREPPISIRLNALKPFDKLPELGVIPWNKDGRLLNQRPSFTLDPAFHAGRYYTQEASSMSLEFVFQQLPLTNALALDLCAAPGGKSTLLASYLWDKGGMVLANEVIKQRALTLKENLIKWGLPNVAVSNLDPQQIAKSSLNFDLIVIDAPCSGEGMFRKDPLSRNEWSEDAVNLCAARQKRIIADILPVLKPGGYLLYSTCTYNEAENEENMQWLSEQHGLQSLPIPFPKEWNIVESEQNGIYGYRFYPHKINGEGFFISLMQNQAGKPKPFKDCHGPGKPSKTDLSSWHMNSMRSFEWFDGIYSIPETLYEISGQLFHTLPLQYLGVKTGELAGKDFKPAPELAFAVTRNKDAFPSVNLQRLEAIQFLRRDELKFPDSETGWLLIEHLNHGIGFVKNLGNRANNQYPKEWRIRMNLPKELPETWYEFLD